MKSLKQTALALTGSSAAAGAAGGGGGGGAQSAALWIKCCVTPPLCHRRADSRSQVFCGDYVIIRHQTL